MTACYDGVSAEPYYRLPEGAYLQLTLTRNHLHLLARFVDARTLQDDRPGGELQIPPGPLAHCFREIADQLDSCLESVSYRAVPSV